MRTIILLSLILLSGQWNRIVAQNIPEDLDITNEFCPAFKMELKQRNIIADTSRIIISDVCNVKSLQLNGQSIVRNGNGSIKRDESGKNFRISITSLNGLKYFTNLEELTLRIKSDHRISLDLSPNTALKRLEINRWNIDTLNLKQCRQLEWLDCSYNNLKQLDLGGNSSIRVLICRSNPLSELSINHATLLDSLDCSSCGLTSINLQNNSTLSYLNCSYNDIETLDLTNNKQLKTVIAGALNRAISSYSRERNLCKLLLPDNTQGSQGIIRLECQNSNLEELNISRLPYLESLNCTRCNLQQLNTTSNPLLKTLVCSFNNISRLDLSHNSSIKEIECGYQGNPQEHYKFFSNEPVSLSLKELILPVQKDNPDSLCLKKLSYSQSNLKVPVKFKMFPQLSELACSATGISSLDIGYNKELRILHCDRNPIRTLNLKNNRKLRQLNIRGLFIDKLDLSHNLFISRIYCDSSTNRTKLPELNGNEKLIVILNKYVDLEDVNFTLPVREEGLNIRQDGRYIHLPPKYIQIKRK